MTDEKDKIIEKLKEEIKRLKKEKEHIEKEFEEFKAKHATTVTNLRKALKIKSNFAKRHKPLGAPKGHKGYTRHIPERVDAVKELIPMLCPCCNKRLKGKTQEVRHRYITDIKLVGRVRHTKYNIHRKYCPNCKKLVEKEVPNALPHARFGIRLMLLVMYLKLGLRLPVNKIRDYFKDMFHLEISEGGIIGILKQLADAFGPYYSSLENLVKFARVKHSDTTSWGINGKNYFAWVFITTGVVLYKIAKRNNHQVALRLLGKKQTGNTLVVDRHSAYRLLAKKAGFFLQFCWSHILEDAKELKESFGAEGKYVLTKLKEIYALATGLNHKGTNEQVEQLKGEIFQLVLRHYKSSTIRKFVNTLYYKDIDCLFRFVTDPEIDSTNNLSERELRYLVIIRKISNGSRSKKGADTTAKLLSVIQSLRLKNINLLQGLQDILQNPSGY